MKVKPPSITWYLHVHVHVRVQPADVSTNVEEPRLRLKRRHPSEFFAVRLVYFAPSDICVQPSSLRTTLGSLRIASAAHNKPTQASRLPAPHKDTMLLQPTARMGGEGGAQRAPLWWRRLVFFTLWIFLKRSSLDPFRFYFHRTTVGAMIKQKSFSFYFIYFFADCTFLSESRRAEHETPTGSLILRC